MNNSDCFGVRKKINDGLEGCAAADFFHSNVLLSNAR